MATTKIGLDESRPWEYDVFLSFRGEDTRKTFTGHLYAALRHASIRTFIDEDELERGEYLAPEFTRAIQSSRIAMIVFSEDYASSRWCLEELVQIIECKEKGNQKVFPIFYNVDPSEVHSQKGKYGVTLAKHEERVGGSHKVQQWRDALTKAGKISGWDLHDSANGGCEAKLIEEIIKKVRLIVSRELVYVPNHVVGLQSRVKHVVQSMWGEQDNSVRMIGIYGIGGVGKTTLAQVLYNKFVGYFERSCFLDLSSGNPEITKLQEGLLSELLNMKLKVRSVSAGIMSIKRGLQAKKCLIVLDNLEHINQFEALCGERDWFGEGSRLILTTREAHLLKKLKKDEHYEVEVLHHKESLQLFSLHAFRESVLPKEEYTELSNGIVNYCGGLPLALEVLGAYLSDKLIEEWISAFEKLKKAPNNDVQTKLKISYDGLPDENIKSLFLDLVCFSNKVSMETIHSMRNFSTIEIRDLADRCLINYDGYRISMHSLIREMGREIIRLESPKNPGERSRLWCPNDIDEVLKEQKGTNKIEMIAPNSPMKNMKYNTKAFQNMENLRFLQIDEVHLDGNLKYLRNNMLRCLNWNGCPLKYIPSSCFFEKLVHLDMSHSNIKEFRAPLKYFPCLEILNLNYSNHLTRTPDFSGCHNLRKLSFERCLSLVEVHSSIVRLGKLVSLYFSGCGKLKKLPNNFSQLSSLRWLGLGGCKMYGLPSNFSDLFMLEIISFDSNNLEELPKLPHSVKRFTLSSNKLEVLPKLPHSVEDIILIDCKNLKEIQEFPSNLMSVTLDGCENLKMLPELPSDLWNISLNGCENLEKLPEIPQELEILSATNCVSMDKVPNLSFCKRLKSLDLTGCRNLQMLPELPHQLEILSVANCESLGKVPNLSYCTKLKVLDVRGCRKLKEIQGWDLLERIIKEAVLMGPKMDSKFTCSLTSNEIPSWITCKEEGRSICIQWPECNSDKYISGFLGFMFSVVINARPVQLQHDDPFMFFEINGFTDYLDICHLFPLEREDISVFHLCLSTDLCDEFCRDIKAGQVMELTVGSIVQEEDMMKKICDLEKISLNLCSSSYIKAGEVMKLSVRSFGELENMMKKIGVAALYRDTDGLVQLVPITMP